VQLGENAFNLRRIRRDGETAARQDRNAASEDAAVGRQQEARLKMWSLIRPNDGVCEEARIGRRSLSAPSFICICVLQTDVAMAPLWLATADEVAASKMVTHIRTQWGSFVGIEEPLTVFDDDLVSVSISSDLELVSQGAGTHDVNITRLDGISVLVLNSRLSHRRNPGKHKTSRRAEADAPSGYPTNKAQRAFG
jgi:hypothetical protein